MINYNYSTQTMNRPVITVNDEPLIMPCLWEY